MALSLSLSFSLFTHSLLSPSPPYHHHVCYTACLYMYSLHWHFFPMPAVLFFPALHCDFIFCCACSACTFLWHGWETCCMADSVTGTEGGRRDRETGQDGKGQGRLWEGLEDRDRQTCMTRHACPAILPWLTCCAFPTHTLHLQHTCCWPGTCKRLLPLLPPLFYLLVALACFQAF